MRFPKAKRIWLDPAFFPDFQASKATLFVEAPSPFAIARFEKEFEVKEGIQNVEIHLTSAANYLLFLDGELLGRGPCQAGGDYGNKDYLPWCFYDSYFPVCQVGKHRLLVFVSKDPVEEADNGAPHPYLLAEIVLSYSKEEEVIGSDETWRSGLNPRYLSPYRAVLGESKALLHPSSIVPTGPEILEKSIHELAYFPLSLPADLKLDEEGYFTLSPGETRKLDFQEIEVALLSFMVKARSKGDLRLEYQEVDGKKVSFREKGAFSFDVFPGSDSWTSLSIQSFQCLIFHYEGIAPLRVKLEVTCCRYPLPEGASFSCDDPDFEDLYRVSARTATLCLSSYHMDSPLHQESLGDIGDYLVQSLIGYSSFGGYESTAFDLKKTARYVQAKKHLFHTSYGLLYVVWLSQYFDYSKDEKTLKECLPAAEALLDEASHHIDSHGLYSPANYLFLDWVWRGEYTLHHPPKVMGQTSFNGFYGWAMKEAEELELILGRKEKAEEYSKRHALLKEEVNQRLFDEEEGLYFDGEEENGEPIDSWRPEAKGRYFSLHTNVLMVLSGLSHQDDEALLHRAFAKKDLPRPTPYFMTYVFLALEKAGLMEELGYPLLENWRQMLQESPSTWREIDSDAFYCDDCHAWSGIPAYVMVHDVIGYHPDGTIAPHLGKLTHAKASFVLPNGNLLMIEVIREGDGYAISSQEDSQKKISR